MKVVYYLAASLDGYIADVDGGVAWLDDLSIDGDGTGYEAFYESISGLVMGRDTYDFVHDYGQWPYDDKPTWVCTTRELSPLDGCNLQPGCDAMSAISEARSMGLESVWMVGGGVLARSLLEQDLLTHISVSIMPVVLGSGIKIVDSLPNPIHLRQERSTMMSGFTQVEYSLSR